MENGKLVVERMTSKGKVEVWVGSDGAGVLIESRVDGRYDRSYWGPPSRQIPAQIKALGYVAAVGRVAITQAEADAVEAAMAEAEADRRQSPDGLRDERESLALGLAGLIDEESRVRASAWEREDEAGAFRTPAKLSDRIAAARKALADFDRAHPEVRRAIRAAEKADAERHMWD